MSEQTYDLNGHINFEVNKHLADHIGTLVISQAQAAGAAKVYSESFQAAQQRAATAEARVAELSATIQEFETDIAKLRTQIETRVTHAADSDFDREVDHLSDGATGE